MIAAVCQLRTETEQAVTMEKAARMVREAAQSGADIVVLPEMFNCPYSKEYFKKYFMRNCRMEGSCDLSH